ncbi:hypothetical protein [Parabacteroides goldsteinii]|uniref:hypothetical protein n=1 Tax=Parabacteroides goldsteinii TaxID=328812 RepID=UPI001897B629|nr:hypothetical protein [Parabacteroides goldsteinii]
MKQLMVLAFLFLASLVNAQDKTSLKDIDKLTFFGVDFSMAKVYGADETAEQFKDAFYGINTLFQREPKKYDTAKAFDAVVTTDLETSRNLIEQIKKADLFASDDSYELTDEEIAEHIRQFNTGNANGYGAVFIAGLLNKGKTQATYNVVVFDIASKDIILNRQFTERARGFGLRNYWAYSVYKTLNKVKKIK